MSSSLFGIDQFLSLFAMVANAGKLEEFHFYYDGFGKSELILNKIRNIPLLQNKLVFKQTKLEYIGMQSRFEFRLRLNNMKNDFI